MLKTMADTFITTIVAFIATTFVTFAAQYLLFLDRGSVTIGPTITLTGKHYTPVDIVNYSSQTLDKVRLSIPSTTTVPSIVPSWPINIEPAKDILGTHTQMPILISGIEAS